MEVTELKFVVLFVLVVEIDDMIVYVKCIVTVLQIVNDRDENENPNQLQYCIHRRRITSDLLIFAAGEILF